MLNRNLTSQVFRRSISPHPSSRLRRSLLLHPRLKPRQSHFHRLAMTPHPTLPPQSQSQPPPLYLYLSHPRSRQLPVRSKRRDNSYLPLSPCPHEHSAPLAPTRLGRHSMALVPKPSRHAQNRGMGVPFLALVCLLWQSPHRDLPCRHQQSNQERSTHYLRISSDHHAQGRSSRLIRVRFS